MAHGGLVLVRRKDAGGEWEQEDGRVEDDDLEAVLFGSLKMDPGRDLRAGLAAAASSSQSGSWPDCESWRLGPGWRRPSCWSPGSNVGGARC